MFSANEAPTELPAHLLNSLGIISTHLCGAAARIPQAKRDEWEKSRGLNDLALRFFPRSGAAPMPQRFVKAKT
jgi:hypothetical protein